MALLTPKVALDGLVAASPAGVAAFNALVAASNRVSASGFPFGNPVSIERHHVPIVASKQYWAAAKTDGIRVAVAFCRDAGGVGAAAAAGGHVVLRTRAGQTKGLAVQAPDILFDGTLLDVELAVQEGGSPQVVLLVFDIAMFAGHFCSQEPLSRRLAHIRDVCAGVAPAVFPGGVLGSPRLVPKSMVPLWVTDRLDGTDGPDGPDGTLAIPTHGCAADGYVFTPEDEPCARPGTAYTVFKAKPVHTLDLWVADDTLTFGREGEMRAVATLRPTVVARGLEALGPPPVTGCVVEMAVSAVSDVSLVLTALGFRPDKNTPNNLECVVKTLLSAADVVTLQDVVAATRRMH
jgi:hypothetical protein